MANRALRVETTMSCLLVAMAGRAGSAPGVVQGAAVVTGLEARRRRGTAAQDAFMPIEVLISLSQLVEFVCSMHLHCKFDIYAMGNHQGLLCLPASCICIACDNGFS